MNYFTIDMNNLLIQTSWPHNGKEVATVCYSRNIMQNMFVFDGDVEISEQKSRT